MKDEKFLIVDGNNLVYSSYHVSQKLASKLKTTLSFFFLRVLFSIVKKNDYKKILIVFDGGGNNFRKLIHSQYKSNRPKMPVDLFEQMNEIKAKLKDLGIKQFEMIDNEADDIIASFIKKNRAINPKVEFSVFTRDKDLLQLIDEKTNIIKYIDKKITLYKKDDFFRDYLFEPESYSDYLSILGDKADNIDGVNGIGPVNSKNLIKEFHSIEKIYESIDKVPENLKILLQRDKEIVYRNKLLIKLDKSIEIPSFLSIDFCSFDLNLLDSINIK